MSYRDKIAYVDHNYVYYYILCHVLALDGYRNLCKVIHDDLDTFMRMNFFDTPSTHTFGFDLKPRHLACNNACKLRNCFATSSL